MTVGPQTLTPYPATARDGFGASPRVPGTGFLVFGLFTFWAYTALQLASVLRAHCEARWQELSAPLIGAGMPADRLAEWRGRGFDAGIAVPAVAAALFALSEAIVLGWILAWVLDWTAAEHPKLDAIVPVISTAAACFYAATLILVLWTTARLRAHEFAEFALVERGFELDTERIVPSQALAARWEDLQNRATLFLVVSFAMVSAPVVAASLFVSGSTSAYAGLPALACMVLGGAFHYWGTLLLLGMFNSHLALEAERRLPRRDQAASPHSEPLVSPTTGPKSSPIGSVEHDVGDDAFVFVSYKREDLERVRPLLSRMQKAGYRLWYDKGIPGGAEWDALTENKVRDCTLLLFFLSRASAQSKHCRREVKYADQMEKPVLAVRLEPAPLTHGLGMLLTQYQIIEADAPDFDTQIAAAFGFLGYRPAASVADAAGASNVALRDEARD